MKKDVLELIQNKNTIRDNASTRKIAVKISSKYNLSHKEQGRLSKPISHTTIRRFIKKVGLYPYKIRKVIGMLPIHRKKRLEFIKQIKERGITGKNIMFTDEKIFNLRNAPNIQNERVYVDPKDRKNLSNGEGDMTLLQRTKERHESQVMVSGGISYFGVTRLILIIGSDE